MFEPFGQIFPPSEAASTAAPQEAGARLARVGIWLFWGILAAVVAARVALVVSGGLFNFAS